jgi:hypothetical protein
MNRVFVYFIELLLFRLSVISNVEYICIGSRRQLCVDGEGIINRAESTCSVSCICINTNPSNCRTGQDQLIKYGHVQPSVTDLAGRDESGSRTGQDRTDRDTLIFYLHLYQLISDPHDAMNG